LSASHSSSPRPNLTKRRRWGAFSHHISFHTHSASFFCCVISCAIFRPLFISAAKSSLSFFCVRLDDTTSYGCTAVTLACRNNIERARGGRRGDLKMRTVNVPAEIIHEISLVFRVAPLPCYLRERGMYLFDIYYETFFCCRAARRLLYLPPTPTHPRRPCALMPLLLF
jgi:hypothetical protein